MLAVGRSRRGLTEIPAALTTRVANSMHTTQATKGWNDASVTTLHIWAYPVERRTSPPTVPWTINGVRIHSRPFSPSTRNSAVFRESETTSSSEFIARDAHFGPQIGNRLDSLLRDRVDHHGLRGSENCRNGRYRLEICAGVPDSPANCFCDSPK
jgi:hypothetical protein